MFQGMWPAFELEGDRVAPHWVNSRRAEFLWWLLGRLELREEENRDNYAVSWPLLMRRAQMGAKGVVFMRDLVRHGAQAAWFQYKGAREDKDSGNRLSAAQPRTYTHVHGPHRPHGSTDAQSGAGCVHVCMALTASMAPQMLSGPGRMCITGSLKVDQCWVWGSLDPGLLSDTEVTPVRETGLFGSINTIWSPWALGKTDSEEDRQLLRNICRKDSLFSCGLFQKMFLVSSQARGM